MFWQTCQATLKLAKLRIGNVPLVLFATGRNHLLTLVRARLSELLHLSWGEIGTPSDDGTSMHLEVSKTDCHTVRLGPKGAVRVLPEDLATTHPSKSGVGLHRGIRDVVSPSGATAVTRTSERWNRRKRPAGRGCRLPDRRRARPLPLPRCGAWVDFCSAGR